MGLDGGAHCLCPAGAFTPPMTIRTASVTPSSTSPTHSAPRNSRLGEGSGSMGVGRASEIPAALPMVSPWSEVLTLPSHALTPDAPPTSGCAMHWTSIALCSGSMAASICTMRLSLRGRFSSLWQLVLCGKCGGVWLIRS